MLPIPIDYSKYFPAFGGNWSDALAESLLAERALRAKEVLRKMNDGTNGQNNTGLDGSGFDMDALSGMGAAFGTMAGIVSGAMRNSEIADTSEQENQIDAKANLGRSGFSNFNQLSNAYGLLNLQPDLSYDTIRGGSDSERFGNLVTNTLTGASLGIQNGSGPLAAMFGGIGAFASGLEWGEGNSRASEVQKRLKFENQVAQNRAERNISYGGDQMIEDKFRYNTAKNGGSISRKSTSLTDFASKVLKNKTYSDKAGIIHRHCKGGTMVRIKRK